MKIWTAIGVVILFFGASAVAGMNNVKDEPAIVSIKYSFNEPVMKKIRIGGEVYDRVIMNGAPCSGEYGEPSLPAKGAYILLPQKTSVGSIKVTPGEKIFIGSGYHILPTTNSIPISEKSDSIFQNEEIYESREAFPGKLFTKVGVYAFRGYEILVLILHPLQYIPATGEIFYYKDMTVSVETKDGNVNPLFRGLEKDEIEVMKKVDNPNVAKTYAKKVASASLEEYNLLIITTEMLKKDFQDLEEYHNNRGVRTVIKTLEEIGTTPEDIREYIKNAYLNWGIEYVLLGGDDDVVPAKMLWVYGLDEDVLPYDTFMPSDLYYACLDGTYNYDGDDKWGEPTDGPDGGDVDLMAEVFVGRACVGNKKEVNNFVAKTIGYLSTSSDDYFKKICLAGEYLGDYGIASWGGNYMDQLIDESDADGYETVGIPSNKYIINKLYDRDWDNNYWPKSEMIDIINNGVHIINHLGHSSYGYNMKMVSEDVESLENTKYCFIYSQGCMAGGFDNGDCMAEYFTVKTEHGAFAAIMNARYGFFWSFSTDGDNQRYQREFWDAVFGEDITVISKANQDSKEDNLYLIQRSMMRWCYYQLNLFGDPTVVLHISNPPEIPAIPYGSTKIKADVNYIYTTSTSDIDGDEVYYKWDWGDGNFSRWIGPYPSGETVNASYTWAKKGIYKIRVKAKDIYGIESEWSQPLRVSVPAKANFGSILERINEWLMQIIKLYLPSSFL